MSEPFFTVLSESIVVSVVRTTVASPGARSGAAAPVIFGSVPSPCGGGC